MLMYHQKKNKIHQIRNSYKIDLHQIRNSYKIDLHQIRNSYKIDLHQIRNSYKIDLKTLLILALFEINNLIFIGKTKILIFFNMILYYIHLRALIMLFLDVLRQN